MIKFRCLNCNQKIGVPDNHAGEKVKCPKYNHVNVVPKPISGDIHLSRKEINGKNTEGNNYDKFLEEIGVLDDFEKEIENKSKQFNPKGESDSFPKISNDSHKDLADAPQYGIADPTKPCPYCRETIKEIAIKCKHCGEYLDKPIENHISSKETKICKTCGEDVKIKAKICPHCGQWQYSASMTEWIIAILIGIVFIFVSWPVCKYVFLYENNSIVEKVKYEDPKFKIIKECKKDDIKWLLGRWYWACKEEDLNINREHELMVPYNIEFFPQHDSIYYDGLKPVIWMYDAGYFFQLHHYKKTSPLYSLYEYVVIDFTNNKVIVEGSSGISGRYNFEKIENNRMKLHGNIYQKSNK